MNRTLLDFPAQNLASGVVQDMRIWLERDETPGAMQRGKIAS